MLLKHYRVRFTEVVQNNQVHREMALKTKANNRPDSTHWTTEEEVFN